MRQKLREAFALEMDKAINLYNKNKLDSAFSQLERAHILGQSYILPHTKSHWWMLKVGFRKHNFREVFGQITRMIASVLFSRIWVPLGNTGGTNVNPLKPMPIPEDLKNILDELNIIKISSGTAYSLLSYAIPFSKLLSAPYWSVMCVKQIRRIASEL